MSTKVLIVDIHAEMYRDRLAGGVSRPAIRAVRMTPRRCTGDLSDIDVLIMFGIELDDYMLAGAPRLKWIQSLATGVDHFLRCPSLKPESLITSGRGIHGAPMRETGRLSDDGGEPRRAAAGRATRRRISGSAGCGARCTARPRSSSAPASSATAIGELLKAFGMHVIGVTRTPRTIEGFDEMMPTERLRRSRGAAPII